MTRQEAVSESAGTCSAALLAQHALRGAAGLARKAIVLSPACVVSGFHTQRCQPAALSLDQPVHLGAQFSIQRSMASLPVKISD